MATSNGSSLGYREQYILASAYFHGDQPEGYLIANCARVLRQAMYAAGKWDHEFNAALHGVDNFPEYAQWYGSFLDLIFHEPESERLLQGGGNYGTPAGREAMRRLLPMPQDADAAGLPAGAVYTACWLTPAGKRIADHLLALHPDWKEPLQTKPPQPAGE